MNPLRAYLDAWLCRDVSAARAVLDDGCVVVDSHGVVLRGADAVVDWLRGWIRAGGVVHAVDIAEESESNGVITAQWALEVTWQGVRAQVEGRSVAHVRDGLITYLREYTTTGPLGDWDGTWKS